ncbi:hypothetical protein P9112_013713 [Eukaryota sp. TZLM1-RC]
MSTHTSPPRPLTRIGISAAKPIHFSIRACKNALRYNDRIAISGIGSSITKAVSIAEILRQDGFVSYERITTGRATMRRDPENPQKKPSERDELSIVLKRDKIPSPPFPDALKKAGERHLRQYWDENLVKSS